MAIGIPHAEGAVVGSRGAEKKLTLVFKIPLAAPGSCREAELAAFRRAFPQGWPDGSPSGGAALACPGGAAPITVPPSPVGLTGPATSPADPWLKLDDLARGAGAPAAWWKTLVDAYPAMACFAFPGNVSYPHLIERCHLIASLHWIWSPALGCDETERDHIVGVALRALALLSAKEFAKAPCRRAPSRRRKEHDVEATPEPMGWTELRGCDLCWRWARRGGQTGHRIRSDASALMCDGGALCHEHRPANGPLARSARKRDLWLKPLIVHGPQPGEPPHPRFSPGELLDAGMSPRDGRWASQLEEAFPLVVGRYPGVRQGLPQALHILSGLDRDSVEHLVASIGRDRSWAGMQVMSLLIAAEGVLWQEAHRVRTKRGRKPRPPGSHEPAHGAPLDGQG